MEMNSSVAAGAAGVRGKSAQSIGQLAKAVVAQARGAGAETPRNAQGVAASGLARGFDMESVLAALVATKVSDTTDATDDAADLPVGPADLPPTDGGAVEGADIAEAPSVPEVEVSALPDDAGSTADLPTLAPVPARTAAATGAVSSSMADQVARDALEMLFGQSALDETA